MKNFIFTLFLLACTSIPVNASVSPPNETPSVTKPTSMCPGSVSQKEFFDNIKGNNWKVYTLKENANARLVTLINSVRSRNNAELMDVTAKVYFANIGQGKTGIVFMAKGCAIKGTVQSLPSVAVANLFQLAAVKDEDFVEMRDI